MKVTLEITLDELEALRAHLATQAAARAKSPALAYLYNTVRQLSDHLASIKSTERFRRVNSD